MGFVLRQRFRCWRNLLVVVSLGVGCGATAADNGVAEASNRAAVGPVVQAPLGDELFALLRYGSAATAPPDRIFVGHHERPDAVGGYVDVVLSRDGIVHPYAPYVLFDAPACEGSAYISSAAARPARDLPAAIVGSDAKLFVATGGQAVLASIESQLGAAGCRPYQHRINARPVRSAGPLLQLLPPPYRVQTAQ